MKLIKKISEMRELRKEEKELIQEELLILREMVQERLNKIEQKQKVFDTMLDMRLPCENIIDLKNKYGEVEYFLMDTNPFTAILFLQEGVPQKIKFKQLTGKDAGKIFIESKLETRLYGAVEVMNKGYLVGLFGLSEKNKGKLSVAVNGYINESIDQHFVEDTELEKIYGKTITLRQLLMRWKTDNRKFMNINIDEDYEMVKRLYDSEDILKEYKTQGVSK